MGGAPEAVLGNKTSSSQTRGIRNGIRFLPGSIWAAV